MGEVFGITSGKGGVGKSTVSVGLASAFCDMGKEVLLVDMDEGLRCLDLILGVDSNTVFDLADALMGKELEDVLYPISQIKGLSLIPAPSKVGMIDAFSFTAFAKEVAERFDIVIFDFPAGIDLELYSCLPKDSLFLTVAVPDPVSVRDAAAISRELEEKKLKARLIINRYSYNRRGRRKSGEIDGIIDSASLQLLGIVPESEELLLLSLNHGIKKRCKAFAAFKRIARRLDGVHILLPKVKKI